jgi:hypothetical protein
MIIAGLATRLRHCLSVGRAWPNWCCRRQLTSSSPKGTQACRVPVHPIILFQVIFTKNYNIDSVLRLLEQLESLQGRLKTGVRRSRTLSGQLISRKPKPESVNSSKPWLWPARPGWPVQIARAGSGSRGDMRGPTLGPGNKKLIVYNLASDYCGKCRMPVDIN